MISCRHFSCYSRIINMYGWFQDNKALLVNIIRLQFIWVLIMWNNIHSTLRQHCPTGLDSKVPDQTGSLIQHTYIYSKQL